MKTKLASTISLLTLTAFLVSCNKGTSSNDSSDSSTSGMAASAVGGALSSSSASGTQARMNYKNPSLFSGLVEEAQASGTCPTFKTTDSTCTTSAGAMWLAYSGCSFRSNSNLEWNGVQQLSMSSGSANCGTFPNPGANGTLYRQFVSSAGSSTPGSITVSASVLSATIDDRSSNLANFDGATISPIHNSGYGSAVSFDNLGARSSLTIGEHITLSGVYDHSLSGTLSLSETTGQRTVSGSMKLYHNLLRVIAISTFTNVIHADVCCWPVGGSVSPTAAGAKLVGKTETLTFSGSCGSGTLVDTDGNSTTVSFNRCF